MKVLTLSTLDPDVENLEQYLEELSNDEFNQLLTVVNLDSDELSDEDFIDISALTVNLYSTEMDVDPKAIVENIELVKTITGRFITSIIIYNLIKKEMVIKEPSDTITLYKDLNFKVTEKGQHMNELIS